ncbi:MAG: triose-phosphate isomerase [Holophagaceae bacterium]|nr:triose-phosphate isomerase [Holophagaceae bacterium]
MRCVVANWKMNMLQGEASTFCDTFLEGYTPKDNVQVAVAPPFTLLTAVHDMLREKGIITIAQNGHYAKRGAFTGEIAMAQVKDAGANGVIIGHSERRHLFGETDEVVGKKLVKARAKGLLPVLCVGETLQDRDSGNTFMVLRQQLQVVAQAGPGPLWVAYEPVWAIGTGRRADLAQIQEAHAFIREEVQVAFGVPGTNVPILYGGSVTPDNFGEVLGVQHVAGALVGGASLDPAKFLQLVGIAQS